MSQSPWELSSDQYSQLKEAGSFGQLPRADILITCQLTSAFPSVRHIPEIYTGFIGFFSTQYSLYYFNLIFSHINILWKREVRYIAIIEMQQ